LLLPVAQGLQPGPAPEYLGCYSEESGTVRAGEQYCNGKRMLADYISPYDTAMTIDKCQAMAKKRGSKYFGMQAGGHCLLGNEIAATKVEGKCDTPCTGAPGDKCGGACANSVYKTELAGKPFPLSSWQQCHCRM
jgi:WSC domain